MVMMKIGIRRDMSHVMMHYNNNYSYSQHSVLALQEVPYSLHSASETSSTSSIFVVAKRYNSISSATTTKHGNHGLVEVTFTLNRHDGDIFCISGSNGGGEGRFS